MRVDCWTESKKIEGGILSIVKNKILKQMAKTKKKIVIKKINWKKVAPALVLVLVLGCYYQFCNVATVNGRLISRFKYVKSMEKQIGKQTLDQMVTEALILGEAQKKGIKIEDADV
ncbi:SurA N-terminal domain-containing protein, partial [Patescibacteria group bacterium]|nr:SurA N-terminal domain-containing protein [Patescibacteria group bacterium]